MKHAQIAINGMLYSITLRKTKISDTIVVLSNNNNVKPFVYEALIEDVDKTNWIVTDSIACEMEE